MNDIQKSFITNKSSDNAYAAFYFDMIHRLNGYQELRFFLMPYYQEMCAVHDSPVTAEQSHNGEK